MVTGQQELQQEVEKGVFRQERDPLVKDDEAKKEGARAKYGSAKSAKRNWGVLKESIVDHSVFIHHDESNKSKENTKWSDINEEEYELTLRECFFLILILLGCGVIAFSFVFEQWPILDSLYFTTVILTTVGYGDITPKTKAGKLFATVFALGGIVILGLALGVLGSKLIEAEIEASEKLKKKRSKAFSKAMSSSETTESNQSFDSAEADIAFPEQEEIQTGCTRVFDLFKEYIPAIGPCVIGGLLIAMEENWGWVDALYYFVVTSTTIGFGDLTPTTTMSKIWALIFIPLAVAAMGYILGNLASQIIDALDTDGDGEVNELEYVRFMLIAMHKVDKQLFDSLHDQFKKLDVQGDGTLNKNDLKIMAQRKMKSVNNKLALSIYKSELQKKYNHPID